MLQSGTDSASFAEAFHWTAWAEYSVEHGANTIGRDSESVTPVGEPRFHHERKALWCLFDLSK